MCAAGCEHISSWESVSKSPAENASNSNSQWPENWLASHLKIQRKGEKWENVSEHEADNSRRDLEILESGSGAEHEHTQVQWRITGRNRPQHPFVVLAQVKGMKERWDRKKMQRKGKKKRKMAPVWNLNTPQRTKNEKHVYVESNSVWVCSYSTISPSFFWLLWIEVPCGQERILFLSHALFSYTCSPLFYTLIPHTLPLF